MTKVQFYITSLSAIFMLSLYIQLLEKKKKKEKKIHAVCTHKYIFVWCMLCHEFKNVPSS